MITLEERLKRVKKAIRSEGGFRRVPEVSAYVVEALAAHQSAIRLPERAFTKREIVWVRRICFQHGYKLSLIGSEWVMRPFQTVREKVGAQVLLDHPHLSEGELEYWRLVALREGRTQR